MAYGTRKREAGPNRCRQLLTVKVAGILNQALRIRIRCKSFSDMSDPTRLIGFGSVGRVGANNSASYSVMVYPTVAPNSLFFLLKLLYNYESPQESYCRRFVAPDCARALLVKQLLQPLRLHGHPPQRCRKDLALFSFGRAWITKSLGSYRWDIHMTSRRLSLRQSINGANEICRGDLM